MTTDKRRHTLRKRRDEQYDGVRGGALISIMVVLVLFFCLLVISVTDAESAMDWDERYDSEYENDYYGHYLMGAAASSLIYSLLPDEINFRPYFDVKFELNKWSKTAISVGVPMVVKGAFEIFDEGADFRDVLEVGIGGGAGVISVELLRFIF